MTDLAELLARARAAYAAASVAFMEQQPRHVVDALCTRAQDALLEHAEAREAAQRN